MTFVNGGYAHKGEQIFCVSCSYSMDHTHYTGQLETAEGSTACYVCPSCSTINVKDMPGVENLKDSYKNSTGAENVSFVPSNNVNYESADTEVSLDWDTLSKINQLQSDMNVITCQMNDLVITINGLVTHNAELQKQVSDPMNSIRKLIADFNLE